MHYPPRGWGWGGLGFSMQGLGCRGWAGGAGEDGLDGLGRAVQEGPAPSRLHVRLCACMCARCACESRVRPTRAVTGPHPVQARAAYQRGLSCKARRACERRWCGPRGPAQPPGRTQSRPGPIARTGCRSSLRIARPAVGGDGLIRLLPFLWRKVVPAVGLGGGFT